MILHSVYTEFYTPMAQSTTPKLRSSNCSNAGHSCCRIRCQHFLSRMHGRSQVIRLLELLVRRVAQRKITLDFSYFKDSAITTGTIVCDCIKMVQGLGDAVPHIPQDLFFYVEAA
jgi:hypothetical protein